MDVGFVISSVAALGSLGAATLRWMSPEARRNRALLGAPRVNIADYVEGELVRLVGTVVSGPTLIAPLSGRTGVLYEARIAPRLRPWTALVHEADGSVFVIDDDTGHAAINTSGALFAFGADVLVNDSIGPAEEAMLARHGKPPDGNLRSSERVLSIGDRVTVCGRAMWEPDPDGVERAGGYRDLPPGRLRLEATPTNPLLIGDFDRAVR